MSGGRVLWPRMVIACVLVSLVAGLALLFRARFATGDVYPAYSSLRGDPLGVRVLFEAHGEAGVSVSRNFRDLARATLPRATVYLSGANWHAFEETTTEDVRALLDAVRDGARLVIAFAPVGGDQADAAGRSSSSRDEADRGPMSRGRGEGTPLPRELHVEPRWLPAGQAAGLEAVGENRPDLPGRLPWRTALAFEPGDDAWRRVYSVDRYAAIIERSYGDGTIVLLGDAFHLSNEAMARSRATGLLTWLQGPQVRAVFDETHLGVVENAGIATLARRYGLTHAGLALIVVAALYLWRQGSSLVPTVAPGGDSSEVLSGRDASSGLVNLLQRALPPRDLFPACLAEYKRSAPWRRLGSETQRSLEALAADPAADPRRTLDALRRAHELLNKKARP